MTAEELEATIALLRAHVKRTEALIAKLMKDLAKELTK